MDTLKSVTTDFKKGTLSKKARPNYMNSSNLRLEQDTGNQRLKHEMDSTM